MSWQEAGTAWGYRARDWAYLMEPLFIPAYEQLRLAAHIGTGSRVLDVGCGAGRALAVYAGAGAAVAGVDASEDLLAIARSRVPRADLKHGTMTSLPWDDASFDVVTGVNSFAYADDGALAEAHRLLVPGGVIALAFWTDPGDFGPCMQALSEALAPYTGPESTDTPLRMADPDVAEGLLSGVGFTVLGRGEMPAISEFPDTEVAYQALASTGMMYPLTKAGVEGQLRDTCQPVLDALNDPVLGVRMKAAFGWVTAAKA